MNIHARTHSLLLLISFLLAGVFLYLLQPDFTPLQDIQALPEEIRSSWQTQYQTMIFPLAIMLSGSINGFYLYIAYKKAHPSFPLWLAVLLGFALYPFLALIGILSWLPLLLISFYQWLLRHHSWYRIHRHGIEAIKVSSYDEDIKDEQCKRYLHTYVTKRRHIRIPLILGLIAFNLFIAFLLSERTIIANQIEFSLSTGPFLLVLILLVLSWLCYYLLMTFIDRRLLMPIIDLLFQTCDPYRTTMLLDFLLEHHNVSAYLARHYLLHSLMEEDNKARIKQLLPQMESVRNTNIAVVAAFVSLEDSQKADAAAQFHEKNLRVLNTMEEKQPKSHDAIQNAKHMGNVLFHYYQEEYDLALQELQELQNIAPVNNVTSVKVCYWKACCLWMKNEKEAAVKLFQEVIEKGNTLSYVEKSRTYLEEFQHLLQNGEQLPLF